MKKTLPIRLTALPSPLAAPRRPWTRLGGLGLLALLGGLGLFASSRPAHTAGGPVPVAISNLPLPTTPSDEAAPRQPFQASALYLINDGSNFATTADTRVITVPAGKRLVIQTVSLLRNGFGGGHGESVRAYVTTTAAGNGEPYALPLVPDDGTGFPGATLTATLYADPGSTLSFMGSRSGSSGFEFLVFSVSGYLVNVP